MIIIVYYSCNNCSLNRVPCPIKAREAEDLSEWMANLGHKLSVDHSERSVNCHPKTLSNIMIPMDNAAKVGGPPLQ